ncbi:regulatory protein, tetR family [Saccharopolyspora antimicrobica]|uniref:Regulatory protein, tetR family n=1 Tax=Saccharopolyspora antimicrobica TaxID=455193 RepID=A0A1I4QWE7_9PSEU|nr:TetR/AcrR family transcriptional regulator C-terminal domain-containing protein [Saccharopolyspora antimicrobica]RKT88273.1 TetR family transcriptional regulator [Saccharopolyspora antimicrobica]SFM44317.1 regulatory protein, tetR family [Saccharopolyspora antimicrobica]
MPPLDDEPPYRRIAAAIQQRIACGELRPGDQVPSTREITREWGVAMATAAKALAELRNAELVETRPGAGTLVRAPAAAARRPRTPAAAPTRERIAAAGVEVADAEGAGAVSMRRIAAELGVAPMSLYRHVANKDELLRAMLRAVFRERPLPETPPRGWRAQLELVCRLQWELFRDHPWLAGMLSLTRPMPVPEAMAHTEWTLRALEGLGLSRVETAREALALPAMVRGLALSREFEAEAEGSTGVGADQWWASRQDEVDSVFATGRFPLLARLEADPAGDLDGTFEHALTRSLDGLEAHVRRAVSAARPVR